MVDALGHEVVVRSKERVRRNAAMVKSNLSEKALKQMLKEALVEVLQEQRELLRDVFAEVLEDYALAEAIREGQGTKPATRDEVFRILQGRS